jgi:hypothetical protein
LAGAASSAAGGGASSSAPAAGSPLASGSPPPAAPSSAIIVRLFEVTVLGLGASAGAGHRLNLVVGRDGVEQLLVKDCRLLRLLHLEYNDLILEGALGAGVNLFLDFRSSLQKAKISVHNLKATNQCTHFSRIIILRFEKFLHCHSILFLCTCDFFFDFAASPFRVANSKISNLADSLSTEKVEEEESFHDSSYSSDCSSPFIPFTGKEASRSLSSPSDSAGLLLCFCLEAAAASSFLARAITTDAIPFALPFPQISP